jgi:hypothetical protein
MKKAILMLAALMAVGVAPSYADSCLGGVGNAAGSTAATIVCTPEGLLYDSLWRCPHMFWHNLADRFGDQHGLGQNLAGLAIGIPAGVLWGIPEGAIRGGHHGMTTGWDKPFSTDSFLVMQEEK